MRRILAFLSFILLLVRFLNGQDHALVNTMKSPYAQLSGVDMDNVKWTNGFWAERFAICRDSMVTGMLGKYMDPDISHGYRNFEIAAGLKEGEHHGPPFHDGDFYKLFEGLAMVYAVTKDPEIDRIMDEIITTIFKAQREDGYIHTPVIIEERKTGKKSEFENRLNFETYNMGHLMTAACVHYHATGKTTLLDVAKKATDFLYDFYQEASPELARNAICPSHYMGVVEMYRTTRDPGYLELARNLIDIRSLVENGTDHNQDRIPFRKQTKAVGHAVRANYLYAGAADLYAETGDDSLFNALDLIWHDLVEKKLYVTGGCGALYDGISPDGTTYDQSSIQQVHQAYGRDYQLPNITAHNESCANIGNIFWNWRMFLITGEAKYMDIVELTMYNSLLAGVSLDGKRYFYTNPLCVSDDLTYQLRWSKEREEYISYCNCCPPNTIRTISEIHNYAYSLSDEGLWVNLYGGNTLSARLSDDSPLVLTQTTGYPWDGNISILFEEVPEQELSVFLRIPGWCEKAGIMINDRPASLIPASGEYAELRRKWKKGDHIELNLPMKIKLIEANPLVEETRNQVAVKRGPVVYCLESVDIPQEVKIFDISIPANIQLEPVSDTIASSQVMFLEGEALSFNHQSWSNRLYREISYEKPDSLHIRLVPYYAWGNRGHSEMTVWLPLR
ncbi:MAG: glycoside hydrolase family 127 protein [Bacteroidales bacterium]|nr:glycoside hydrolase family 127 protein [Bacteroidales bacterium]